MAAGGWKPLLAGAPWFRGEGSYRIDAYSEFVPPPRLGPKPYGGTGLNPQPDGDPHGWAVTEHEEAFELRPGLEGLARRAVGALCHLGRGEAAHGIARGKLLDNPYWPPELAEAAGKLGHERYVVLLPLALSRTQDDKGRVRWTLFGGSEQGPAAAFWKGFLTAPGAENPVQGQNFLNELLVRVYGEPGCDLGQLRGAGLRILPAGDGSPGWPEEPLPLWTAPLVLKPRESLRGVKYLQTFRPFGKLPAAVRRAYLAGELNLLPFPGSLVFWGVAAYRRLQRDLPLASQIPLLHLFDRHENPHGIRVPQSGWMHEPRPGSPEPDPHHGPLRNTYKRTHRWARVHRHEDELDVLKQEDKTAHVLFSTAADDLGLYGKPMARNAQVWTHDGRLLLDGPRATGEEIERAAQAVRGGGLFGYRFLFPAMRVGRREVYWHRVLAAYLDPEEHKPALLPFAPLGYLTAYDADRPDPDRPVELWPRLLRRDPYVAAEDLFTHAHDQQPHQTARNVHKLFDARKLFGAPLQPSLARSMVSCPKHQPLDEWLDGLPGRSSDPERARRLVEELRQILEPPPSGRRGSAKASASLTYAHTAKRSFEVAYWKTIAFLAEGQYLTKNNADCVRDPATEKELPHRQRDLDALAGYLLAYYTELFARHKLTGKALAGELPFRWHTEFRFGWMGGWLNNQAGEAEERDVVVVIPGKDRGRAVIMADHYDTAYMADRYDKQYGGSGARLAAAGADDNHSATAALMLAAPLFLEMSRAGRLGCDVWLVHLTGEEFPADCLGARALCQRLVEGTMKLRLPGGAWHDLSGARVQGVYVSDMIAHNNDHERDVFQISPGTGPESLWLAYQAHLAAEAWNAGARVWNRRPSRRGRGRGRRSADGATVPETARHPELFGEVRLPADPRSTLYNTDGQIFSDAGVPVVLFMENYDINRTGYHDTHDTMANIDLDYGAALAAIVIESVARAATERPPPVK
jgi:hypothetical protein